MNARAPVSRSIQGIQFLVKAVASFILLEMCCCLINTDGEKIVCRYYNDVCGSTWYVESTTSNSMETWRFYRDSVVILQDWFSPATQYQPGTTENKLYDSLEVVMRKKYLGRITGKDKSFTMNNGDVYLYFTLALDQYVPGTQREIYDFTIYQNWFVYDIRKDTLLIGRLNRENRAEQLNFAFLREPPLCLMYRYDFGS